MPTLEELRNKWFLDFNAPGDAFPPVRRHQGTAVSAYTDGNLVTLLVDGEAYLGEWQDRALALGAGSELYQSSWRLDAVRPKGDLQGGPDSLEVLNQADNADVEVYVLTCGKLVTLQYNAVSHTWLEAHFVSHAYLDDRFPAGGSNHQKFAVFKPPGQAATALLGSLDPTKSRWDRSAHHAEDDQRHPDYREKPTHDLGVRVEGPAVADIEQTFRERWNDPTQGGRIASPMSAPLTMGPHSVQVLHTYGIPGSWGAYSWSPAGEFTIWASYLKAIKTAASTIYIEDQYLFPFDWPVCFRRTGPARDTDLIYQLGEAIKRGVKVAIVVPFESEDYLGVSQKYQRDLGVHYLAGLAANGPGDLAVAYLENGPKPIMVHSKVMVCDDELALVGSANFSQRSMTHDGELQIAVVDDDDVFARDLRATLMSEHLQRPAADLLDPVAAFARFKEDLNGGAGVPTDTRVRRYPTGAPGAVPPRHESYMRRVVDPYAGPDGR